MEDEYRWVGAFGRALIDYLIDCSEDCEQGWAKVLRAPAALQQNQSDGE